MGNLNGRITRIEKTLESDSDGINPFRLPEAWEAYGLLLEYGMRKHAADLYTNGRIDELKQLWVDLAAKMPHRLQPKKKHLVWAVNRMPYFLEMWQNENVWQPTENEALQIADILTELNVLEDVIEAKRP